MRIKSSSSEGADPPSHSRFAFACFAIYVAMQCECAFARAASTIVLKSPRFFANLDRFLLDFPAFATKSVPGDL